MSATVVAVRFVPEIHCRKRWRGRLSCALLALETSLHLPRALLLYIAYRVAAPAPPEGGLRYRVLEWAPRIVVDP